MAITSSVQASSATPAGDFYTLVTGVMTTGGWTLLDTLTAAEAGNTGDASENVVVKVWGNTASIATATCFIYISTNESGTAPPRLRFRVSEKYDDTGAQPGPYYPVPGVSASVANTPAANDSVTGTENADNLVLYQAASTTQKVGWVDVAASANGFSYIIGANAYEVVVATSVVFSANSTNYWFHGGVFRSAEAYTSSTTMCYIGGNHTASGARGTSWDAVADGNIGCYRTSRDPGTGANSTVGVFSYGAGSVVPLLGVNAAWGGQPGAVHQWLTAFAAYQVYLHNVSTTAANRVRRTHLAKLSSMAIFGSATVAAAFPLVSIGDTISISGVTYYIVGPTEIVGSTAGTAWQCQVICAKSSAF